jgi:hypothetical protein
MRVTKLLLAVTVLAGAPAISVSATEANRGGAAELLAAYYGQQASQPPVAQPTASFTPASAQTVSPAIAAKTAPPCRSICPFTGKCLAR